MSDELRRSPYREGAVLALGALLGAGLVWSAATFASARPAAIAPRSVVAEVASTAVPLPLRAVVVPSGVAPSVVTPAPVAPSPVVARPVRRRQSLSQLPDGVFARLRRSNHQYKGELARLLGSGSHLLEDGASWKAMFEYSGALKLDPRNRDALMGLALCHYELGHGKQTRQLLQRVLTVDHTHPEALILRGFIAQLAGQPARAIDWYERALPRIDDEAVSEELRNVIAGLRPQASTGPTITARAEN